jgi:hypothetical protein
MAKKHNLIVTALLVPSMLYLWHGEENRLVRNLEARGYTDVQIEHPKQYYHCYKSDSYTYRAHSPSGTSVHGGACVSFFGLLIETTEPIGKTMSARG